MGKQRVRCLVFLGASLPGPDTYLNSHFGAQRYSIASHEWLTSCNFTLDASGTRFTFQSFSSCGEAGCGNWRLEPMAVISLPFCRKMDGPENHLQPVHPVVTPVVTFVAICHGFLRGSELVMQADGYVVCTEGPWSGEARSGFREPCGTGQGGRGARDDGGGERRAGAAQGST